MKINNINWGDDSAEKDPNLLDYFVFSDAFERLKIKSKSIVVGRKGSGKSALRKKLTNHFESIANTHVINITPKYNSIKSILNDSEISEKFGSEMFFQHTWLRLILLDALSNVGDKAKGTYAVDSMAFARDIAVQLNQTNKDLVENISDFISKIKAKVGSLGEFGLNIERELRELANADTLEYHFNKITQSGAKFVIFIDDLDLGWDNSKTANDLLLGLLSALNHLTSLSMHVYVCVFLREDVYSIIITQTQHSDKYRNIERIRWQKEKLIDILNSRINFNRKRVMIPESGNPFITVFPETIGTSNTDNWLFERTLSRPRELIQLARYYSELITDDKPDDRLLKDAEIQYSAWKLDDLCAEYSNQYSGLVNIFTYWKTNFFRQKYHLKRSEIDDFLLKILCDVELNETWFNKIVNDTDLDSMLKILYEIGFIGDFILGGDGGSKTFYSYNDRHAPRFEEVQVHPCFRKAVNTVERIRS